MTQPLFFFFFQFLSEGLWIGQPPNKKSAPRGIPCHKKNPRGETIKRKSRHLLEPNFEFWRDQAIVMKNQFNWKKKKTKLYFINFSSLKVSVQQTTTTKWRKKLAFFSDYYKNNKKPLIPREIRETCLERERASEGERLKPFRWGLMGKNPEMVTHHYVILIECGSDSHSCQKELIQSLTWWLHLVNSVNQLFFFF